VSKRASGFVDKEKQVLIKVAEKIGSTLGQVADLGQVAKKASRATIKPVRRRGLTRSARTKSASKKTARRIREAARSKNKRSARRRK
jgi:hypothetical protein